MEQGGAGKYPHHAVGHGCDDDDEAEVASGMGRPVRELEAFHRPLQKPWDEQREAVGEQEEERASQVGPPVGV